MGKKGSWLSVLKRVFTATSKDKPLNRSENKNVKEKTKWGKGKFKHGETNSFFPLHKEPSSIEKILGDAEREIRRKQSPPPKRMYNPKPPSTRMPIRTTRNHAQASATKIQATYRGYMARKNYKSVKGLVRLQAAMRGQRVKRQTVNAMRCMQLLVRVQTQVHSRRIQLMESKRLQQYSPHMSESGMESTFSKWSFAHQSEAERQQEWDYSRLTKEEIEARMQRKLEAVLKRERALAYAYSRQLLNTPKSGGPLMWWNWIKNHIPDHNSHFPETSNNNNNQNTMQTRTPTFPTSNKETLDQFTSRETRFNGGTRTRHVRDDESLTSCPAFAGVPSYMAPTVSARAKVRVFSRETPSRGEKKRFSFGVAESIGSMRWKDSGATPVVGKHRSMRSIGSMSLDSTASMPVGFRRNRFGY